MTPTLTILGGDGVFRMPSGDPRREIEMLRERLENGDRGGSARARDRLLELSDNIDLLRSQCGDYRHRDILRRCTRMAEETGRLVDALASREAAEDILRWINANYDNPHTNQDYRKDLRAFGRYALKRDEPPECIDWIPATTPSDFDPVPNERDLVTFDETKAMADAAQNPRDTCLIMLQFEAGLRGGELYDLTCDAVFDGAHSMGVHVDGKNGERAVHLIVSTPYLNRWLDDHPNPRPGVPMWTPLDDDRQVSYHTFLEYFRRAAKFADISKDVTPTAFRKSNTRWLVRMGWSQAEIEDRQGRARGSDHTARYMARFGEDSLERSYADLHGKDVDLEDTDEVAPLECPRCERETPRDESMCMWCGQAMKPDAITAQSATRSSIAKSMSEMDDSDRRALAAQIVEEIEANPRAFASILGDHGDEPPE